MYTVPLTQAVNIRIEKLFPESRRAEAAQLLETQCARTLPFHQDITSPERYDRIRFAVLKLSNGNLVRLEKEIREAHIDWRDTLMAAGFGEDETIHTRWMPDTPV